MMLAEAIIMLSLSNSWSFIKAVMVAEGGIKRYSSGFAHKSLCNGLFQSTNYKSVTKELL